jgi:hypothetical protein
MQEAFLHFLWQYQYFEHKNLQTTQKEFLEVLSVGVLNRHAGADFGNASVRIGETTWTGDIELHLKSSDWLKHQHQNNDKYNKVILHVVWENDLPIQRPDGSWIPTLELKNYVKNNLLYQYRYLMESKKDIPCEALFSEVPSLHVQMMMDKALVSRLEKKAGNFQSILLNTQKDWEETTYRILAQNFGFKVNNAVFLRLAEQTPLKVILKHRDNLTQIEAILFGQAGFLEQDCPDEYFKVLQKEYQFLKAKYQLSSIQASEWNFSRLRPANFPTIRLAQFAQILHQNANLFSVMLYAEKIKTLKKIFETDVSVYWQNHYTFGKKTEKTASKLGKSSIESIVINTIVPLLVLYAQENKKQDFLDKAIDFLENLPAENNHIIEKWQSLGLQVENSASSQALIEQYNDFCTHKRCLECSVGVEILKKNKQAKFIE